MKTLFVLVTVVGIVVGAIALFSAIVMFWLGAMYGYFGLLAPLGIVDSAIIGALTALGLNVLRPATFTARLEKTSA